MLVCLNGTFLPHESARISINDGGLLFGDTLFETLKAKQKSLQLTTEHLDRLELSARLLHFPCRRQAIEKSLQQLANALTSEFSRIRLTIGRGSFNGLAFPDKNSGWYLLTATALDELAAGQRLAGASCMTAPNQRVNPLNHLPQMKRGNYLDCLYAANYARAKGAREALFVDEDKNLLEGSTSNLFALIDNQLVTPPAGEKILAGIMRKQIIATATELGIPVRERNLPKAELFAAEEAFICNSLVDILPIASLDGQPLNRGESWKELLKTLQLRIET